MSQANQDVLIYTIGHSNHPVEHFLQMLNYFGVIQVIDVRTIPRSRHNPQYNKETLQETLHKNSISYIHLKGLGGLRHTTKSSINTAWKNTSFRGYADYMQTPDFSYAIDELTALAKAKVSAIMCAEAVPWRCHRSLIGDALLVRNFRVEDILNANASQPHLLTPWAKVDGITITYPGQAEG